MRSARAGKERNVVRLMNAGTPDLAIAYMKKHGMIGNFAGAPQEKPVSVPEAPRLLEPRPPMEAPYPEYKPQRDPTPETVVWARIERELGNELQKSITFEEQDSLPPERRRRALLWMTLREQESAKLRGRIVGQAFPVWPNPNEMQGGYVVWHR